MASNGTRRSSRRIALRASLADPDSENTKDKSNNDTEGSLDIGSYLKTVCEREANVERSSSESVAMSSLDVTKRHQSRQNNLENAFVQALDSVVD